MIGKDKIIEILKKAVSRSKADQTEILVMGGKSYLTGFANNYIHRNVGNEDYTINIRLAFGKRIGSATVHGFSEEIIEKALKDAELIAENQKENPDFVSFAKPSKEVRQFDEKALYSENTANCDAECRAKIAKEVVDASKKLGLNSSGTVETETDEIAIVNSLGVEKYCVRTVASIKNIAMAADSSGYSKSTAVDITKINVEEIIKESTDLALSGRGPISIEPGKYEVILTPYAVAEFISHILYLSLNARAVNEGSSFLIGNFGKRILGDNITMYDDGLSEETIPLPFDFEGVDKKRVVFFENGVAKDVVYDTLTAYKEGRESTGHSLPQPSPYSPYPMNFVIEGGNSSPEEMISNVKRGLFVQRFWYTNPMDPKNAVITGMTRDGLFLIENGKITKPVMNMRFTESVISALNNVIELSKTKKIIYDMASVTVPYLRVKDFTFTGKTEF